MKKSAIFIILVAFVISIFVLSSFGTTASTTQLKSYFTSVEILNCEPLKGTSMKAMYVDFNAEEYQTSIYIEYKLTPDQDEVTETDAFEFVFPENLKDQEEISAMSDSEKKQYEKERTILKDEDGVKKAELQKNVITFYDEWTATVMLRTLDGSNLTDTVMIFCSIPMAIE